MDENNVTAAAVTETEPAVSATAPDAAPVGEAGFVDEDVILPENWKPQDGEASENPSQPSAEEANLFRLFGLNPDGAETSENPESKPEGVPDAPQNPDANPDGTEPPKPDDVPDYKAMYEELLRSTREAQGRETFRQVYAEQKAAGMSDATARLVAKDAAGGKEFSLTEDAPADAAKPDYAAALNQLHSAFPDVKEIPAEVTKAMLDGGDPVTAYMGYQRARDQKTIGELRAKLADMERKASNTVHAVARGVSGSGAKQEAVSPFLQGMMAEDW